MEYFFLLSQTKKKLLIKTRLKCEKKFPRNISFLWQNFVALHPTLLIWFNKKSCIKDLSMNISTYKKKGKLIGEKIN